MELRIQIKALPRSTRKRTEGTDPKNKKPVTSVSLAVTSVVELLLDSFVDFVMNIQDLRT